jgi:hypothetical protein
MLDNSVVSDELYMSDYDKITDIIDTKEFTKLDGVEIIDSNHPFMYFIKGFSFLDDTMYQNILHGWYHIETGTAKFLVKYPHETGNIILTAWKLFIKSKSANIFIYGRYCGQIYESNEYDISEKSTYKSMIIKLLDKITEDKPEDDTEDKY